MIDVNTFFDGILQSRLHNNDAIVKKMLLNETPNIRNYIQNIQSLSGTSEFINNYFGLLRTLSLLEFMPLSWFENQASFIRADVPTYFKSVRREGIAYMLLTFVKLNIQNNEDVSFIKEASYQFLASDIPKYSTSQLLNLAWCMCVEQRYGPEWQSPMLPMLNKILAS